MTPKITNEELTAFVEGLEEKSVTGFMDLVNSKEARLWIVEGLKQVIDPNYAPANANAVFAGKRIGEDQRATLERNYTEWNGLKE